MSKAFTKEDDGAGDDALLAHLAAARGDDEARPITPAGAERARAELARLRAEDEALRGVEGGGDPAAHARSLAIRALEHRLDRLQVVPPPTRDRDKVQLGASVRVRYESGRERDIRVVGVDEVDASRGDVSYRSPMARALLGARAGETVVLASPRGDEEIAIVDVRYDPCDD